MLQCLIYDMISHTLFSRCSYFYASHIKRNTLHIVKNRRLFCILASIHAHVCGHELELEFIQRFDLHWSIASKMETPRIIVLRSVQILAFQFQAALNSNLSACTLFNRHVQVKLRLFMNIFDIFFWTCHSENRRILGKMFSSDKTRVSPLTIAFGLAHENFHK